MLDAQLLMISLYPLPTWRHLDDLVCQQDQNLAVIEFPHFPEKMNHILTPRCGPIRYPAALATCALRAEITLERRVPLSSEIDIPLTDVC